MTEAPVTEGSFPQLRMRRNSDSASRRLFTRPREKPAAHSARDAGLMSNAYFPGPTTAELGIIATAMSISSVPTRVPRPPPFPNGAAKLWRVGPGDALAAGSIDGFSVHGMATELAVTTGVG